MRTRLAAVLEVVIVFAAVHVAFRAFKRFTAWGRWETETGTNVSPGLIMVLVTVGLAVARRRQLVDFGLFTRNAARDVSIGIAAILVMATFAVVVSPLGLAVVPAEMGPTEGVVFFFGGLLVTCGVLWVLRRTPRLVDRIPGVAAFGLLALLVALPLAVALRAGRPLGDSALTLAWLFFCAGFGEEIFFRGYVQSRVNQAWGRPWRLLGVPFGAGLIVAALLFGAVHALNPFDYFGGHYRFNGWHALTTIAAPYGFLRERTGSVLTPAVTHGLLNVLMRVPAWH